MKLDMLDFSFFADIVCADNNNNNSLRSSFSSATNAASHRLNVGKVYIENAEKAIKTPLCRAYIWHTMVIGTFAYSST